MMAVPRVLFAALMIALLPIILLAATVKAGLRR